MAMLLRQSFIQVLSLILIFCGFLFFFWASFYNAPNYNKELIASIKDFIQNILLAVVMFFFGKQQATDSKKPPE